MIWLIILILSVDTLKYDNGTAEGFYMVGDYVNDKFAVKFEHPYKQYKVLGILVFANTSDGFIHASLCPDNDGLPDTINTWAETDSLYSSTKDWAFTPIEADISSTTPIWVVLRMSTNPAIGGDTSNTNEHSWYYSNIMGWKQSEHNWFIRLVVEWETGYCENFADSNGRYIGNWEFGVPTIVEPYRDNCFGTKLDSLYPHNSYLQLESPWISIKNYGFQNPVLCFKHSYNTQYETDGGNVKISQDLINWEIMTPLMGYDIVIFGDCHIAGELGFSGNSGGWHKEYFPLPPWDSLKVRWCFGSDEAGNDFGWFIDEVSIGESSSYNDVSLILTNFGKIISPETIVIPEIKVKNTGVYSTGIFSVECVIESSGTIIYQDNKPITSLIADSIKTINFKSWNTGQKDAIYEIKAYSKFNDDDPTNDTIKVTTLSFPLITEFTSGLTITTPSIDGIIDSIEWEDATLIDGSNILEFDSKNSPGSCNLYFMNSNSTLYIACKAKSISEMRLYIDDSGNKKWDKDGSEGFYRITSDKYGFQDMYYHLVHSLPDYLKSIGSDGVELAIPIGTEPYKIAPTCSLGCFIYAKSSNTYVGWLPQAIINYNNPINYIKIRLTGVGVEEEPNQESPKTFKLEASPNPFIKSSSISYQLSTKGKVSLRIYDIAGNLIYTLVNEEKDIGHYRVHWKPEKQKLKTGIYFVKFTVNDYKETKKIILMQ